MFNFLRSPEGDDLLDHQQLDNALNSLNTERQKLSFWIRFVCALALLLSGFGVMLFSYIFLAEIFSFRNYGARGWYIGGTFLWIVVLVVSILYAKAGSVFAKITLAGLVVITIGTIWILIDSELIVWDNVYSSIRYMRMEEFVLVSGLYTTGLLVFPAAWFGWRYAQALKIPQLETDWDWKNKTAVLGFKSWRLGAMAFMILGIAWTPIVVDELASYKRRFERKFMNNDTIEMPYNDDIAVPVEEPDWEPSEEEREVEEPNLEIDDEVVEEE